VVPLLALTFTSGGVKLVAGEIWIRGLTSIIYVKLFILNALNKPNSPTASVSVFYATHGAVDFIVLNC